MTQAKHTPGPWEVKPSPFEVYNVDHGALLNHVVAGDIMIAALYDDDLSDANARLIAAAPDLLEALEATRLVLAEHEPHPLPVLAQVLAAIAKAKGEKK